MSNQARSIDEVITRLNAVTGADQEDAHIEADRLLLDALLLLGGSEVVSAYQAARERVGFWYA